MYPEKCESNADKFGYVCGKYTVAKNRKILSPHIEKLYQSYSQKAQFRNVWWAPSKFCANCYNALTEWSHGKLKAMRFGVPMVWSDPIEHKPDRCYFCVRHNTEGHTVKSSRILVYRSVPPHAEMPRQLFTIVMRCQFPNCQSMEVILHFLTRINAPLEHPETNQGNYPEYHPGSLPSSHPGNHPGNHQEIHCQMRHDARSKGPRCRKLSRNLADMHRQRRRSCYLELSCSNKKKVRYYKV